jgi:hypothetical protein
MRLCCNACISDKEEGGTNAKDDTNAAANDTDAAADNAAPDNDNYATMPPKLKPLPRKPGTKKTKGESNDVAAMPTSAPKPPENFSVDSTDKFLVSYHCEGSQDLTDVAFQVNGVLRADINYCMSIATDRKSILWQCAIQSICFSKKILTAILKEGYSPSSHRTIAYDDVAQEMQEKKIHPKHKLYLGAPQVVRIKWECTGTTTIIKQDYEIDYVNVNSSGRRNHQCNLVLIVQVKKAKERAETEAVVNAGQISLFGAFGQSSHGSSGNPPSPPPRCKSPRCKSPRCNSSNHGHKVDDDDGEEQFPDEYDENTDDRGRGYGGGRDGGGKRKRGGH